MSKPSSSSSTPRRSRFAKQRGTEHPVTMLSGAASGVGRHMAIALARAGHRLVLTDIDSAGLDRLVHEQAWQGKDDIIVRPLDARDSEGWTTLLEQTVSAFGQLDTMLNVAGYLATGNLTDLEVSQIDRQIDVNVKGLIYATRAGARHMREQGWGHILNVASIAGLSHVPGLSVYCASKHAVRGFSLSVAHELRPHNVQVTVFCPDAVETPMLHKQEHAPEAAMTFGAGRALTLVEVEATLFKALRERPLEVVLDVPLSGRAIGAKVANMFPVLTGLALGQIRRRGERVQMERMRRRSL